MTPTEDQALSEILDDSIGGVFSFNIYSLKHKTDELFLLIDLNFLDIVTITELWLNVDGSVFVK